MRVLVACEFSGIVRLWLVVGALMWLLILQGVVAVAGAVAS